jgi:hypothetical protein
MNESYRGLSSDVNRQDRQIGIFNAIRNFPPTPLMTTPGADAFPRADLDAPFAVPEKKINSEADVVRFQRSVAFTRYMDFIEILNAAVKGKTCLDEDIPSNPTISRLIELLDVLNRLVDEVPPSTEPRRFGNVAFRTWMAKLNEVPKFAVRM